MVARGIALVPEKRELFGEMTVEDNLLLGGFSRWRRGQRDQAERMGRKSFDILPRLGERRVQISSTLSGGERQMLAIGCARHGALRPPTLDEPSLGLAPRITREGAASGGLAAPPWRVGATGRSRRLRRPAGGGSRLCVEMGPGPVLVRRRTA